MFFCLDIFFLTRKSLMTRISQLLTWKLYPQDVFPLRRCIVPWKGVEYNFWHNDLITKLTSSALELFPPATPLSCLHQCLTLYLLITDVALAVMLLQATTPFANTFVTVTRAQERNPNGLWYIKTRQALYHLLSTRFPLNATIFHFLPM